MTLDDKIYRISVTRSVDSSLDPVETTTSSLLGKCKILPNTEARHTRGEDGADYIYSYTVFLRRKSYIPVQGDTVRIVKKDGTVDRTMTVTGFVTLKNWVKIWM